MAKKHNNLVGALTGHIRALKLRMPEYEYRFAAKHVGDGPGVSFRIQEAGLKNWRFDMAWPDLMFAVEVEGGGWIGGRHVRGKGFHDDLIKYHHAMAMGWTVYRCDAQMIQSGLAARMIEERVSEQNNRIDKG